MSFCNKKTSIDIICNIICKATKSVKKSKKIVKKGLLKKVTAFQSLLMKIKHNFLTVTKFLS